MEPVRRLRRHLKSGILPAVCVMVIAYFGYHLVEGERGLSAYARLSHDLVRAEALYRDAMAERHALELRTALLHPSHIDPDMLDERARVVLGVARRDEVVIYPDQ